MVALFALLGACASARQRLKEAESSEPMFAEAAGAPAERNSVNLLVGVTIDRADDGFTLGGNYERRLGDELGVGGFADATFGGDHTAAVVGPAVFYHPADRWVVFGGPGVEFFRGDAEALARLGVWYEFPVEKLTLSPTFFVDLGGDDDAAAFLGVSLGWKF
ncbi:MAG: hypothetical protein ACREID_06630 [Planctomycetota bacterium]